MIGVTVGVLFLCCCWQILFEAEARVKTVFETSVEYLVSQNLFQITINSQFKKDLYLQIHLHKTVFVVVTKQEFLLYGTKSMRNRNFLGLNI